MACHIGSVPLHAVFALLHLTALFWPTTRCHAPLLHVIGVTASCSVLAAIYHAAMILTCESSSFSEALHAYWETDSLTRLRMVWGLIGGVSIAWSACWCVKSGTGRFKTSRMAAVIMLAFASACLCCWAWSTTAPISDIWGHRPLFQICNRMAIGLSWVYILTDAGSANLWHCILLICGCSVVGPIVRTVYYPACVNAVHGLLSCVPDTTHPHWPALFFFGLEELAWFTAWAGATTAAARAVSGIKGHARLQPATPLPTRTPRFVKGASLKHIGIVGAVVCLLVSLGVPIMASWLSSSKVMAELKQQSRELLSMYSTNEVRAYICTHACLCTFMRVYARVPVRECVRAPVRAPAPACVRARVCAHACICACTHACTSARVSVPVYVCGCACTCECAHAHARACKSRIPCSKWRRQQSTSTSHLPIAYGSTCARHLLAQTQALGCSSRQYHDFVLVITITHYDYVSVI